LNRICHCLDRYGKNRIDLKVLQVTSCFGLPINTAIEMPLKSLIGSYAVVLFRIGRDLPFSFHFFQNQRIPIMDDSCVFLDPINLGVCGVRGLRSLFNAWPEENQDHSRSNGRSYNGKYYAVIHEYSCLALKLGQSFGILKSGKSRWP